jgi:WD40 repeat protein
VAKDKASLAATAARRAKEANPERSTQAADRYGDPLPHGTLARLGSMRFRHGGPVSFAVFSPDGKKLASGTGDGVIHLWEVETGKELAQLKDQPNVGGAFSVCFTPDGKHLAAWSNGNGVQAVRLWELATGAEKHPWPAPQNGIQNLTFSPDGKHLALVGNDQAVKLVELASGKEVRQLLPPPQQNGGRQFNLNVFTFSGDGKTLAAGGHDGMAWGIRLVDVATGNQVRQLTGTQNQIVSLVLSPDGKLLIVRDNNQAASLRLVATGKELRQWTRQVQAGIALETFAPDGKTLACAAGERIHLEEALTGKKVREWKQPHGVSSLTFSADGKTLAVGGMDNVLRLCDVAMGKELRPFGGHQGSLFSVAYSPDGKTLASAAADQTIRLWEPATGKEIRQFTRPSQPPENQEQPMAARTLVAFSPDGKTLAAGWPDGLLSVWEVASGKVLGQFSGTANLGLTTMAFSPNGAILAVAGTDGMVRLRQVATGKEVRQFAAIKNQAVNANGEVEGGAFISLIAFSADGKTVVTGGFDNQAPAPDGVMAALVQVWEVATGKERRRFHLKGNPSGNFGPQVFLGGLALGGGIAFAHDGEAMVLSAAVFAPDGRTLALGNGNTIHLWDLARGREVRRFGDDQAAASSVVFSPDGKVLAAGSFDGTVCLWEVATGTALGRFPGHRGAINHLAFSPDGRTLASGGMDTTALVWDAVALIEEGRREVTSPAHQKLEILWHELAGDDATRAYQSIWSLAATPDKAVPFLRQRLRRVPPVDTRRLTQLIADLDSNSFEARRSASEELEKLGDLAEAALQKVLKSQPSLEVRQRAVRLVERLQGPVRSPEQLRALRAIEVLELIGSPAARELLDQVALGAPESRVTAEARAAAERLARRTAP